MDTIAVLIPCFNEEKTIARVVSGFRSCLPNASIYVYDNNSTDTSALLAASAGAIVRAVSLQGKGHVVRAMFLDIKADIYIIADADGQHPPEEAPSLIAPLLTGHADMVIGRRSYARVQSNVSIRRMGNSLLSALFRVTLGAAILDVLSGYRAFTKDVIHGVTLTTGGFEIETELTAECVRHGFRIIEIPVLCPSRVEGSVSKIHIVRDGVKILKTIFSH